METGFLQRIQEKKILSTFRRAARNIPFYRKRLKSAGIDPGSIRRLPDFTSKVPVLDKDSLFNPDGQIDISDYCPPRGLDRCRMILPSSGFSGKFSFGLISEADSRRQEKAMNYMFRRFFGAGRKKTMLINTLSMGINVPATNVVSVNTGLRSDTVLSVMKVFAGEFDQLIIIGENGFIKNALEYGLDNGVTWRDHNIHLVFGGESFPESFRGYLEKLIGHTPEEREDYFVGSSFGFAEAGLNVLWETPRTIRLRKAACADRALKSALMDGETPVCPLFFQYNPMDLYVEDSGGRLLFTNLNPHSWLPIIRYATGDKGKILEPRTLEGVLRSFGLSDCMPEPRTPIITVKNRDRHISVNGREIFADMIKNAFYSAEGVPGSITGYFRMCEESGRLRLEIQLKKGARSAEDVEKTLRPALREKLGVECDLLFYPYAGFPYAMELDYERKFRYYA